MTFKCIAIDDEPFALKQIGSYINKTPFLELVALCNGAHEAMESLHSNLVNLMFVDINMPDMNGMEFVKSLTDKPFVVFTTAYSEYAIEGFKVDAVDYLLKPIGYADFLKAANKVRSLVESKGLQFDTINSHSDHLFVKSEYKLIRIELSDIKYIEGMHEYICIHLLNNKPIMTLANMNSMEDLLPASKFMRIHRSYIVNLDMIKVIERNRIVFDKNTYIPVSEQYKSEFQEFVNKNFLF